MKKLKPASLQLLLVWTVWFVALWTVDNLFAAEGETVPSWRTGVSRWNGSGYELPANVKIPEYLTPSSSASDPAPYTIPVDPTVIATRTNPYFDLPEKGDAPLRLPGQPSGVDAGTTTFAPPANAALENTTATESAKPTNTKVVKTVKPITVEDLPPPDADPPTKKTESKTRTIELNPDGPGDAENKISKKAVGLDEPAPLATEVTSWYQYPRKWMRGWNSHAELGLNGSNGNSDALAFQTGLELKRKAKFYTLGIDVDYRQASSRDVTVEDNGRFNVDYDRLLRDSPWAVFGKYGMEWDKFKAFDLRLNVNGGLGYHWIRSDDATLVTRFGAGASQEIGAPDDDWVAEGVFGIEAERQLNARQKLKGKVDYFPAWEDFSNYRLVSDFAWEILLDESDNLSLKLAATDRYDSTPQGAKPNDVYYSLLLLYKF